MTRRLVFTPLVLAVTLAACGGNQAVKAPATVAPPLHAVEWSAREHVGKAIELLNQGQKEAARSELADVLRRAPSDPIARSLYAQLDEDPKATLGAKNFAYKVKPDETMSEIAQRFLGDPLRFYILARYNNIAVPNSVAPGQSILIPGKKPAPAREEAAKKPAAKAQAAPTAAAAPAAPVRDPARASRLRAAALEQMNRGAIDRAAMLLHQALLLDPENPLIRRDFDRAMRIRSTVHARR